MECATYVAYGTFHLYRNIAYCVEDKAKPYTFTNLLL